MRGNAAMRIFLERNKWLIVCLGVLVGLSGACSDDEAEDGGQDVVADAGDTHGAPGPSERGDTSPDAGERVGGQGRGDAGDLARGDCDINGLTLPDGLYIAENTPFDDWGIYRLYGSDYIELSLVRDASIDGIGTLDFASPETSSDAYMLLGTDCDQEERCQTYYNADSGTLEVTAFDKSVLGSFKASLKNIRLSELDQSGHAAAAGKTWCVASAELTATTHPLPKFVAPACSDSDVPADFSGSETEVEVSSDGWMSIVEVSGTSFPRDEMRFKLNDDYEVDKTYQIDDVNRATCTACLSIQTGCDEGGDCTTRYNAGAGELTINALDTSTGEFEATLKDARFVEVTHEGDYSIIVDDGGGWCIDAHTFSGTFAPPTP